MTIVIFVAMIVSGGSDRLIVTIDNYDGGNNYSSDSSNCNHNVVIVVAEVTTMISQFS